MRWRFLAKITLKDIADATGFSIAKVSRAINETGAINDSDKTLIIQKAMELGYDFRVKKANEAKPKIAVVVPRFDSYTTSKFIQQLNDKLINENYIIDYYTIAGTNKEDSELLEELADKDYKVIIYKPLRVNDSVQGVINNYDIPIFSFGQVYGNCININYNNFQLLYDMTSIAIKERKCRRLLYIGTYKTDVEVGIKRLDGFLKAVSDYNASYQYRECVCDIDSSYELCESINFENFDAILCATDNLALGVHRALMDKKIVLGKDIKLSGVGDNKVGRIVTPSLTTVSLNMEKVVEIILERLKNNDFAASNYTVPYEIIRRESL